MNDASFAAGNATGNLERVSDCLFCSSPNADQAIEGVRDVFFEADPGEFTYIRCAECGSLWLETRPVGPRLLDAYSNYHTHAEPVLPTSGRGLREVMKALYVKANFAQPSGLLERLLLACARTVLPQNLGIDRKYRFAPRSPARVFDYGCGSGEYLLWLQPLGYTLCGADFDPELLDSVSKRGIQIEDVATVDPQAWAESFDHITLVHVVEHVPDPIGLLGRLFAMLKPGGTLYIEVPNADAEGVRIYGRYWRGLEAPRHFALPTRGALANALKQAGFVIDKQPLDRSVRGWMWAESRGACPPNELAERDTLMRTVRSENEDNAEFLMFVARKPAA